MQTKTTFGASALALCVVLGNPAHADAPLDAAVYDIGRIETQAAGLAPGQTAKIARLERMIEQAGARLAQSAARDSAAWQAANARLEAVRDELAQAKAPRPPSPNAHGLSNLDVARLQALDRRAEMNWRQIQMVKEVDWQRQIIVARWRHEIGLLERDLGRVAPSESTLRKGVEAKVAFLADYVKTASRLAEAESAALAGVADRVEAIETWERALDLRPPGMNGLGPAAVDAYAARLSEAQAIAKDHHVWLESVKGRSAEVLPSRIESLEHRLGSSFDERIAGAGDRFLESLSRIAAAAEHQAAMIEAADPADPHHQRNQLAGEKAAWARSALTAALAAIGHANRFARSVGVAPRHAPGLAQRYQLALEMLETKVVAAAGEARFPEVRSRDPELREAATAALAHPSVGAGEILRLEITSERTRHAQSEGDIHVGAVSIDVTLSEYVWEEVSVTTAERDGTEVALFANLLRIYRAGGSDVPIGRWVVAKRHRLGPILAVNVGG